MFPTLLPVFLFIDLLTHGRTGESVTKLKGMLTAAQAANPPTKEVSKNGFSFRHPDAPPPFDDVSYCNIRRIAITTDKLCSARACVLLSYFTD